MTIIQRTILLLSFAAIAFISFLLPSCGKERKGFRIGVAQCSNDYWREKTNEDLRRELMLQQEEAEIEIRMADSDNARQIADIRYFVDNGFDLIIVAPNESEAIAPALRDAVKKGVKVVTFDRKVADDAFTAHIEVDNRALGEAAARYAPSVVRKPLRAVELQGPAAASPARLRHEGFQQGMANIPGAQTVSSVYADWDGERAYRFTDSILKIHPETNLIFAHTDHMAIRASHAASEAGRGDIRIIGIDGFPHIGLQAVKDSVIDATFLYSTEADRIIRTSLAILKGEKYIRVDMVPPLSPVDASTADILLSQDSLFSKEGEKIDLMRGKLDEYWQRHSMQTWLLYAAIIIILLAGGVVALLLRTINSNRRHKEELEEKNLRLREDKEREEQLNERLQEATRSKLTFFTNVSHDLRTPLALIAGPLEELEKSSSMAPREKTLLRLAGKNVSILRRLINQILDFRKYENGKTDLQLRDVNLLHLLREWTEAFHTLAAQRHITLSFVVEGNPPSLMAADTEKMERVFFNLMSNAFKHTPDNGKITVACSGDDGTFRFSVADTGSGISSTDCARIFERFYQAEGEQPNGSGIGLALTKAFIELHGGSIEVESEPGKGSVFKVELPVRLCGEKGENPAAAITPESVEAELEEIDTDVEEFDSSRQLLLVIDDNRDIREMLGSLLGGEYNVIFAADGRQGIRMAMKYVPDLILCDVMMPGMDGMECVGRLKKETATSHIPVLMLTACALDEQKARGFDSGADGYLPKPFSNEVLKAQIRSLILNRKRIWEQSGIPDEAAPREQAAVHDPKAGRDVENEFFNRFISLVRERMADSSLSVEDLAGAMGLSQSQLTRKIKAISNYTPVEIIRLRRLAKARRQLATTDRSVSEIAFGVGFSSLAYFSKCYREAYGVTPTEAREGKS